MVAAKKMEKKIHDQLDESNASKQLRSTAFEMALFGTGIMKGPFAIDKEYPNWSAEGEYSPLIKTVPSTSHVSVWNFYADPDAINMDEAQYIIERHKMSRTQIRALKKRPFFRKKVIDDVIAQGESYVKKYWEDDLMDYRADQGIDRFEVLEFWGSVEREILEENDVKIPKELENADELQANIWYCNNRILRMVLNPFKPARIPYYAVPYELNPYSLFGIGIAENMDDTQTLMNGFMRMAVDNAVLSGNLVFEVDETNLVPGQDMTVYPGKVFRRQGGAPGQSIFGTKFPNVSNENLQLFDKARVLADESTGLPSFSHGQTGVAEASIKAAKRLGIPVKIRAFQGYQLRTSAPYLASGVKSTKNTRAEFLSRFFSKSSKTYKKAAAKVEETKEDKTTTVPKTIEVKGRTVEVVKTPEQQKVTDAKINKLAIDDLLDGSDMIPDVPLDRKKRASAVMNELYGKQGWQEIENWWKTSPLRNVVDVERLALVFNSDAYATFMSAGSMLADAAVKLRAQGFAARIELYGDALPVTLYHEAWHAFSQLVLSKEEKAKLYNEIRTYEKWKNMEYIDIEEELAEEFIGYAAAEIGRAHV
jgi:hypothetical protein